MNINWNSEAWKEYVDWQSKDKKIIKKIFREMEMKE